MTFFRLLIPLFLLSVSLFAYPDYSLSVKEKKIYPMGAKIYAKKCQKINLENFKTYNELHKKIQQNRLCGTLSKKHAEALSLYLWDSKKNVHQEKYYEKLVVTKKDKCPVCGMFLYKYPRWVARIKYAKRDVSFDGIKDMMKYYFEHKKGIKVLLVQEYYTQKTINAKKAYFVLGSDVYGPMGNELIAFKDKNSAKKFFLDHKGKKILRFDEITENDVYKLDE